MAVNTQPKPTAAFALSVFAGLGTILVFLAGTALAPLIFPGVDATNTMYLAWGTFAGVLVIFGSWLLFNNVAQRKLGSILVLVFSLISMNFIGLILGLIGGFLGYTTKTTTTSTNTSTGRSYNPP